MIAANELTTNDKELLSQITEIDLNKNNAYNIRKDGVSITRNITKDISIITKEDKSGIDIYVNENTKHGLIMIPVIITQSGLEDIVYNDFHIGRNAHVTIIAGCGINNPSSKKSKHHGIHRFFIEDNAYVKYVEKHYGTGHGTGHKVVDPITEINLKDHSIMEIETIQIEGVDSTTRVTSATIEEHATLKISEKIMTSHTQKANTEFEINLNGQGASTHVTSRSVATEKSKQVFISKVNGNAPSFAHVECDAILKDKATVQAKPEITANHVDANLIHEATIGKIAGAQLLKLMSLGLNAEEAEKAIINGFLN